MRIPLLLATIAGLSLSVSVQVQAAEPAAYDTNALPRDEASLSKLDSQQLRLVRRATNQCDHTDPLFVARLNPARRPCVVTGVDHAVETSDDPALQAYHAALPFNARYDQYRASYYWQRLATKPPN